MRRCVTLDAVWSRPVRLVRVVYRPRYYVPVVGEVRRPRVFASPLATAEAVSDAGEIHALLVCVPMVLQYLRRPQATP